MTDLSDLQVLGVALVSCGIGIMGTLVGVALRLSRNVGKDSEC